MIDKSYILFDLDGTITDPRDGITKSVQYSLKAFGIDVADTGELIPFIGPPLRDSYRKYYGFDGGEAERAVAKYREYFAETGIFENTLYDGMDALLKSLCDAGKRLILATSKTAVFAERILKYFGIDSYFTFVSGSEWDGRRSQKGEVIRYALEQMNIVHIEKAVMVGDREYDILGAREAGMDSIGVLYGYGDRWELTGAGATWIAASVGELAGLLHRV